MLVIFDLCPYTFGPKRQEISITDSSLPTNKIFTGELTVGFREGTPLDPPKMVVYRCDSWLPTGRIFGEPPTHTIHPQSTRRKTQHQIYVYNHYYQLQRTTNYYYLYRLYIKIAYRYINNMYIYITHIYIYIHIWIYIPKIKINK